jgi:signal transduction histidine kinase
LPDGDQFAVRVKSLDAERAEQAQTKIKLSQDNRSDRTLVVSIGDPQAPQAFVELSNGPNFGDEAVATTSRAFVLAGFGAMLLAVLIGLFVSRDLTAPLSRLTTTATRMSNGDLAVRAPVLGQDEFGQLAQQFNRMAERLEESFTELAAERDALRRFIADASHELRTPITALKNFNELLQNAAADDPAAQTEFLQESEGQIKRLEWITHNLLNLSRFDAGLVELDLAEHDLGTILTDLASSFRTQVQEKQIKLTVHLPELPTVLACDRPRLELALANLLKNGLRFVPPGGHIDLDLKVSSITDSHAGEVVQLQVRDDGAGIDPTDLPHIFERFYRGRNNPSVGSGLGLAIVKTIIQAHQGRVAVESRLGEGSRFLIELPLSPSNAGLSAQN